MADADTGTSSDDELRFLIQRVARDIRRNRGGDTLSDSQMSVLFQIERLGVCTPSQLVEAERVTPPAINRTINRLAILGLVTRTPSQDDARKVLISQTDAGRECTRATRSAVAAWFSRRLAELEPEERAALADAVPALRKLVER